MLKGKFLFGILFGLLAVAGISASVATFIVLKNKKNKLIDGISKENPELIKPENNTKPNSKIKEENEKPKLKEIPWNNIFPDIKSSDYYNMLNFRNGQAWIDENMIVNIIKDVINRTAVIDGEIKYAYKIIDDQNVLISFIWQNNSERAAITYKISTNKL